MRLTNRQYRNLVIRNKSRILEIERELIPLKKTLLKSNPAIEKIIKKLDILEVKRRVIKDTLNSLNIRWKRGELPSKESYRKETIQLLRYRNKNDRAIDYTLQKLRNYLYYSN